MGISNACYKKPFLKQVIARVDFVAPIVDLEKNLPLKLGKVASAHFPISEPMEGIAKEFRFDPRGVQETQKPYKQWSFFGKVREKELTISSAFMNLVYTRYTTYEDMKEHFSIVVDEIADEFPDVRVARFGLRFINVIENINLTSPTAWNVYISKDLLGSHEFFAEFPPLTRLVHVAELKEGEIDLRFQYGMPNPDYPAVMKRPVFILDLDAYVSTAHDLKESPRYIEQAHKLIQNLFERSITEKLRARMDAK
jgi:uncharacterized protein (TIGR04255 family)